MHLFKHRLGNPKRCVAPFSPTRTVAQNQNSRFVLKHAADSVLAQVPHACDLCDRKMAHLAMRRHRSIAKVAMGRKLGVRLYWMWRNGCEYSRSLEFGSYAGQLGTGHGTK